MDKFSKYLLTGLICLVALGQFVQVVTRYLLQIPVMGLEETMLYPTIWLYILGAVNASREDTHIRANVLEIAIKTERGHTVLAIIGEIISLAVGLWLLSWALGVHPVRLAGLEREPDALPADILFRSGSGGRTGADDALHRGAPAAPYQFPARPEPQNDRDCPSCHRRPGADPDPWRAAALLLRGRPD